MKKRVPKAQKPTEYQPPKPLWRFGWRGWTLLPIAMALAVIFFTGYDLRTPLLTHIYELFGIEVVMWIVTTGLIWHSANIGISPFAVPSEVQFGLVTLCLLLIGMGIHPKRFRSWAYLSAGTLGLAVPPMAVQSFIWLRRSVLSGGTYDSWQSPVANGISLFAAALVAAVVLWCITRSWRIFLFLIVTGALAAWLRAETWMTVFGGSLLLGQRAELYEVALRWAWHPALFGILLWWAIRARRHWKPPWACQSCGYDLRGTPADPCPECGTPPIDDHQPTATPTPNER